MNIRTIFAVITLVGAGPVLADSDVVKIIDVNGVSQSVSFETLKKTLDDATVALHAGAFKVETNSVGEFYGGVYDFPGSVEAAKKEAKVEASVRCADDYKKAIMVDQNCIDYADVGTGTGGKCRSWWVCVSN